jgi:hypothetical protein
MRELKKALACSNTERCAKTGPAQKPCRTRYSVLHFTTLELQEYCEQSILTRNIVLTAHDRVLSFMADHAFSCEAEDELFPAAHQIFLDLGIDGTHPQRRGRLSQRVDMRRRNRARRQSDRPRAGWTCTANV